MPIRTKSVYDPPSREDGTRVLVTHYWPRGVRRDRVDEYVRTLGPSRELLRGFRDGDVTWPEYRRRYLQEMRRPEAQEDISRRARHAREGTVTFMCVCRTDVHCHRRLLRELVESAQSGE
jgi:uncharacterized protein YeaO (DUF488 family)